MNLNPEVLYALLSGEGQGKEPAVHPAPMQHCDLCEIEAREDRCFVNRKHRMKPGHLVRGVAPTQEQLAVWAGYAAMWRARFNPPAETSEPFVMD